jgi:Hint domain
LSGTISSAISQGITLSTNPTTITASGTVTTSLGVGVTALTTPWTFGNSGIVTASASGADGVSLAAGGVVNNLGTISAYRNGIDVMGAAGTVTNSGTLDSSAIKIEATPLPNTYDGVYLAVGGIVTNLSGGVIFGGFDGIDVESGTGIISNDGDIHVSTAEGNGVNLLGSGNVTNLTDGTITGTFVGVGVYGGVGTVTNSGTINAMQVLVRGGYGIYLEHGGAVTNLAGGSISGAAYGVLAGSTGPLVFSNAGYVYGGEIGADLEDGGTITNTGTIIGDLTGVSLRSGTLINAGIISAARLTGTAVTFGTNQADRLVVETGAVFGGTVSGWGANSVLELAASEDQNTLAGFGTTITNFPTIAFDPGAQWQLSGTAAAFNAVQTITGFATGDTIRLNGVTGLSSTFDTTTDQLTLSGGGNTYVLKFDSAFPDDIVTAQVSGSDTTITLIPCFAAGTRIATPGGETPVEKLREGDRVLTAFGELLPVTWAGHRRVQCDAHPTPERVRPIRVAAHAFAEHEPHTDLLLSPDHAVLVNEVLVPVKHLVNGSSIRQLNANTITYYHIELPHHSVLLAEGLPTGSYLDVGDRGSFGNNSGLTQLQPVFGGESHNALLIRDALACAPLCVLGPEVDAARSLLASRLSLIEPEKISAH